MKLDTEFCRLPLCFDPERLAAEALQFDEREWKPHPQGHPGNTAIPLIAANGDPANDEVRGAMRPTPLLSRCPYVRQVLASLGVVLGRTRFMRIAGQGEAKSHVDTNYYWSQRVRVHVPVVTYPGVRFICGEHEVFMPAGETWIFDTWRRHNVLNPDDRPRIHLVTDTVGSPTFWELVEQGTQPFEENPAAPPARLVPFFQDADPPLETELVNFPVVMSPWEQEHQLTGIFEDIGEGTRASDDAVALEATLRRFHRQWRSLWARHGADQRGEPDYRAATKRLQAELDRFKGKVSLINGVDAVDAILQWVLRPALNFDLAGPIRVAAASAVPPVVSVPSTPRAAPNPGRTGTFDRPVFVVAAPRSGSTLLFETLTTSPDFWTIGGESHEVFEAVPRLHPANREFSSNRLTEEDADPETIAALHEGFRSALRDRDGRPLPPGSAPVRMLEKTPKNALRIPFLRKAFPDSLFVYLFREPEENIGSIIDAWRSGRFVTYPKLPGWDGPPWSLLLIPGWRELRGKPLAEVTAAQWESAHRHILDDLEQLPRDRWCTVNYADVLTNPQAEMERLCRFAGVRWDQSLSGPLPLSRHTLTPPRPDKWRVHAEELTPLLPGLERTAKRARQAVASDPTRLEGMAVSHSGPAARPRKGSGEGGAESLRSVHTSSLAELLNQLRISLLVTTYQAGKLIVVRADAEKVNTHFRTFPMPMGLALSGDRLALGTKQHVWDFRNQPAVAAKLPPSGQHDACFLPRSCHFTGDIRVHELGFARDGLWAVNTRFSCLCTLDADHSFVPRWRPPFVTGLTPDDRCHLNGLAVVDGSPRYVTCLGETDTPGGWRANKKNGGLLLDVPSGEPVLRGLSMPHSPRWHDGKLWVLESGLGGIGVVDRNRGRVQPVATLPGFTRGLDFHGPLAFVGLSQVRETSVFSGIPITERLGERVCGVWVVDLRNGQTVGFLRFEAGVQEIFAVQVLAGIRFPDIITDDDEVLSNSFVVPDSTLRG